MRWSNGDRAAHLDYRLRVVERALDCDVVHVGVEHGRHQELLRRAHSALKMRRATSNRQRATDNVQRPACNRQQTTDNVQDPLAGAAQPISVACARDVQRGVRPTATQTSGNRMKTSTFSFPFSPHIAAAPVSPDVAPSTWQAKERTPRSACPFGQVAPIRRQRGGA